jgi:hypothetical protein
VILLFPEIPINYLRYVAMANVKVISNGGLSDTAGRVHGGRILICRRLSIKVLLCGY